MTVGSAVLQHGRVIVVDSDSSFDRYKWYVVGALILVAIILSIANLVRWRRGKHRADPQLQAVEQRVGKVEQLAGASSVPVKVAELQAEVEALKTQMAQGRKALTRAWGATGQPLPAELRDEPAGPHLRMVKGDGGAA